MESRIDGVQIMSRVRPSDDLTQTWRITRSEYLDQDDCSDHIGTTTDFETLPHLTRMTVEDFTSAHTGKRGWRLDDVHYEDGFPVLIAGSYYDTEYDRSTEQSYDTLVEITWELESFG